MYLYMYLSLRMYLYIDTASLLLFTDSLCSDPMQIVTVVTA